MFPNALTLFCNAEVQHVSVFFLSESVSDRKPTVVESSIETLRSSLEKQTKDRFRMPDAIFSPKIVQA